MKRPFTVPLLLLVLAIGCPGLACAANPPSSWTLRDARLALASQGPELRAVTAGGGRVDLGGYFRALGRRAIAEFGESQPVDQEYELRPVSLVGNLVSFKQVEYRMIQGGIGPHVAHSFVTLAVGPGVRRVGLLELFREQDVLAALLGDAIVRNGLPADARPKSLKALYAQLQAAPDGAYGFEPGWLDSFAFHHLAGDRVAVRIGLPGANAVNRGRFTELGLKLPLPANRRADFKAASGAGLLMDRLKGRTTTIALKAGKAPGSQP